MTSSHRIAITDESSAGEARRHLAGICGEARMDETMTGRAAIVCMEMARNMVRHAGGGSMILRQVTEGGGTGVELLAVDGGRGMDDVARCLRDGHSTGGTSGTGLGAIQRLSNRFDIYSQPGKGTAVRSLVCGSTSCAHPSPAPVGFEVGGISVALQGEMVCGDAWDALPSVDGKCLRLMVADGLGHGAFAEQAARAAVQTFHKHPASPPAEMLDHMHHALLGTRGAAASMLEIKPSMLQVTGAGVGNVAMRLVTGSVTKTLISDNGTLGANVRRMQEFSQPWTAGTVVVMHSDGLGTQWNLADYPGLSHRHPSLVAAILYRDFHRIRDDVTVVVIRYHA